MIDETKIEKVRSRSRELLNMSKEEEERGLELHRKYIVCDALGGGGGHPRPFSRTMTARTEEMLDEGKPLLEILQEINKMGIYEVVNDVEARREYIEAWEKSGVTSISQTLGGASCDRLSVIEDIASSTFKIDKMNDVIVKATTAEDIRKAKRNGKHAIIWNLQNTLLLGGGIDVEKDLDKLNLLYRLGVRIIQLTYNLRNFIGDGCTERYESGLSYFGVRVVERMNDLGILIDTAHSGYKTTLDAVEISKKPVVATHTSCKSIYPHSRGKTDEELKAIAEKDGFVGIVMKAAMLGGKGTINEFLDHIDHAVDLIGVDHVAVGSDRNYENRGPQRLVKKMEEEHKRLGTVHWRFPSGKRWWFGWRTEEPTACFELTAEMSPDEEQTGSLAWINWPYVTVGLVSRGYSNKEIEKIIGGNFLRVLECI